MFLQICSDGRCIGDKSDPKDRLNLHKLCKRKTGNENSELYSRRKTSPDDQCTKLKCQTRLEYGKLSISTFDIDVKNGSWPCGGSNINGVYINKPS